MGLMAPLHYSMPHGQRLSVAEWDLASWWNIEIGAETNRGRTPVRGYAGYGAVVNDYDRCDDHEAPGVACQEDSHFVLYIGVSFGWLLF